MCMALLYEPWIRPQEIKPYLLRGIANEYLREFLFSSEFIIELDALRRTSHRNCMVELGWNSRAQSRMVALLRFQGMSPWIPSRRKWFFRYSTFQYIEAVGE